MQRPSRHVQPVVGPEKAFGQALRKLRAERKLSQEQLGLACNVDRTYVSLLERGLKSPTLRTMFRLCDVLEISFGEMARHVESVLETQVLRNRRS